MDRKSNLLKIEKHPFYRKLLYKLNTSEISHLNKFVLHNNNLDKNDFAFKATRFFLDSKEQPKRLGIIVELLLFVNSN